MTEHETQERIIGGKKIVLEYEHTWSDEWQMWVTKLVSRQSVIEEERCRN